MNGINNVIKWQTLDDFYIDIDFSNDADYMNFLNLRKSMSMFDTGVEVSTSDKILILCTYDYTRTDSRFVVMAKLVQE